MGTHHQVHDDDVDGRDGCLCAGEKYRRGEERGLESREKWRS